MATPRVNTGLGSPGPVLDLGKLEKLHERGGKHVARCPACAETDNDRKGEHLFIAPNGRFGCVQFPGSDGERHRKRIFELVGIPAERPLRRSRKKTAQTNESAWATLERAVASFERSLRMHATRRDCYRDRDGSERLVVVRFDNANEKQFRPFHRNRSGGWIAGDPPEMLPPFGLPELCVRSAERVFLVEGEK